VKQKLHNPKAPLAQFIAIIALTISIFLVVDFGRRAAVNYRSQREAERLGQEVDAVRQYKGRLLAQRTYAASDLYVEEVARNELKWAKPGETVIVVMPSFEPARLINSSPQAIQNVPVNSTPQQAWWQLFFGNQQPNHFSIDQP
jgi:cell division protein FtsB